MTIKVKTCGLTSKEAIDAAVQAGADYAGFVFFEKSPRHITLEQAAELLHHVAGRIPSVAVTVNPDDNFIKQLASLPFDILQLHGSETVQRVKDIRQHFPKLKLMKALAIRNSDDIAKAASYETLVDYLLFDAKAPDAALPGGNGLSFDWQLLKDHRFHVPWFLAGGINAGNISQAISESGATMVDVSSCVESSPGVKDVQLIKQFVEIAKSL